MDINDYAMGLLEELDGDARALGCREELSRVSSIIRHGSGADRQLDHYRLVRLEGATKMEALRSVVDLVIAETRQGVGAATQ